MHGFLIFLLWYWSIFAGIGLVAAIHGEPVECTKWMFLGDAVFKVALVAWALRLLFG